MADIIAIGLVVGAYLYGSAPFIWMIAKFKNVDLRQFGTRNIGTNNLIKATGYLPGVFGAFLDFSKGLLPVLLGYYVLDLSIRVVCLAGLMALIGQMWPVFLKFSGGRGATAAGSVATAWLITPLLSWKVVACITPLVVGAIWRNLFSRHAPTRVAPLGLVLTFALLPVLTWLWGKPPEKDTIYLTFVAIFWLLAIRRLTADLRKELQEKPSTVSLKSILINRFLYDRSYR